MREGEKKVTRKEDRTEKIPESRKEEELSGRGFGVVRAICALTSM